MLRRYLYALFMTSIAAGCDGDHDSTAGTATHGATHSGGSTTSDPTDTTANGSTSSGTTDASTAPTTGAVAPPAAPTDLAASILEGGVHLTWKDASDNEDNFVVENKADGAADFSVVIELPFDTVTYHDIDVMAGTNYTYRVKAVNAGGESLSNEVAIMVP